MALTLLIAAAAVIAVLFSIAALVSVVLLISGRRQSWTVAVIIGTLAMAMVCCLAAVGGALWSLYGQPM